MSYSRRKRRKCPKETAESYTYLEKDQEFLIKVLIDDVIGKFMFYLKCAFLLNYSGIKKQVIVI